MRIDTNSRPSRSDRCLAPLLVCLVLLIFPESPVFAAAGLKPLEVKQRYAQVLGVVATGDLDRAVGDLLDLEAVVVGDQQPWRYVDNLWRSKLQVIRDLLAGQNLDLLKPVIMLHHDAYFRYSELDRPYLAQHSRTMATELAEIYAERAGSPAARSFAAWTLTSFAGYLWSPSNIGMSAELFFRAFSIDPGNDLASQGLAAAWERSGSYEKAIENLTQALRLRPGDPQLSLRLALCHLRDPKGSHQQALQQLTALTRAESPAWIQSVAFQELARAQLAGEETGRAEATLRQGLQQLPGDQQISLQLASILDSQRRRSEARAILEGIDVGGWERESARQTYDFWVPPDLSQIRSELHREMEDGRDALAASLQAVTAGGAGS